MAHVPGYVGSVSYAILRHDVPGSRPPSGRPQSMGMACAAAFGGRISWRLGLGFPTVCARRRVVPHAWLTMSRDRYPRHSVRRDHFVEWQIAANIAQARQQDVPMRSDFGR